MEYQALYRKYRPQRFDEVVGQDHVTQTLSREVVDGKIAHAYLFAGPRGTGKTTSARLLAKALNCTDRRPDGEPCNVCTSCVGIIEGTSLDVIELDAASHNKVEDIREIRINVGTVAAAAGAFRIYILDEAHMLSRAAGNALLKTLEEPPEHVVFVLATTEPYKLLDTIRSRAQRFDFHPVSSEILIDYLEEISRREGFAPDGEGLAMVAGHARGSVRDAMSLLEQVAALGVGKVEAAAVARALGLADRDAFALLADAVKNQDAPAALGLVARLASQGADLRRFVADAVGFFRGVFLAQYAPNLEEVVDDPQEVVDEWRRFAKELSVADVLRSVDQLADALMQLRQGREERLVTELTMLRLTRPETALDPASLSSRLQRLEDRLRHLGEAAAAPSAAPAETARRVATEPVPSSVPTAEQSAADDAEAPFDAVPAAVHPEAERIPEEAPAAASAAEVTLHEFEAVWPALVAGMRDEAGPRRHAFLKEAAPQSVDGGKVRLAVPGHLPFHLEQLREDEDLKAKLERAAADLVGGAVIVEFVAGDVATVRGAGTASDPEAATEFETVPDKDGLLEEGEDETDPASLVVDVLGGEIVSD